MFLELIFVISLFFFFFPPPGTHCYFSNEDFHKAGTMCTNFKSLLNIYWSLSFRDSNLAVSRDINYSSSIPSLYINISSFSGICDIQRRKEKPSLCYLLVRWKLNTNYPAVWSLSRKKFPHDGIFL